MKYQGLTKNNHYKNFCDSLWDDWADDLGFKNKRDMLTTLYEEWSMEAIADLLGVAESTVFYQLRKLKIQTRKRKMPIECKRKRGNPLSMEKIKSIQRRFRMNDKKMPWAELGRQFNISEITAKKYVLQI